MFSRYLRAATYAVAVAPVAAFVAYVLGVIVPMFNASDDHMLVQLFTKTADHYLLLGLVAVAVIVGAGAIIEGRAGGGR